MAALSRGGIVGQPADEAARVEGCLPRLLKNSRGIVILTRHSDWRGRICSATDQEQSRFFIGRRGDLLRMT